ncbi:hypothetical protein HDV00_010732 [Rhizophlyctis rosea]|nr:hypothetical protein HDV00_010732 [Rhizophlyctis rosea]
MPLPVSKKKTGLGKSLMRSRFANATHTNPDGSIRHTTELDDAAATWMKMQSVTQENDLDAFLSTAELAGTEFTAERLNITVISTPTTNPFLLTPDKEQETLAEHEKNKEHLTIPRRPHWDSKTTADELQRRERDSFLDWRRGLVMLEEEKGLLLTPYERNLEVWRQLWRVIERSDLVVQIVDGRNPLLFRSTDLEIYVKEVDERKKNLLLVNKADMLSVEQRTQWADWFDSQGIRYTFFSAAMAKEKLEKEEEQRKEEEMMREMEAERRRRQEEESEDEEVVEGEVVAELEGEEGGFEDDEEEESDDSVEGTGERGASEPPAFVQDSQAVPDRVRIVGADELIDIISRECPTSLRSDDQKVTIGFVGYPNVGKSSTLNALAKSHLVTVSSTPGKTKHFQTIHLSDSIILCDCPGLVFPSFATTKAEMVVNGVLPIDQLREFTGPAELVAQRVPKGVLEGTYGIRIRTRDTEGREVERVPRGEELLRAYAIARGYTKSSQGNPDEARAARYILKDYVNGKLLYAHPPPTTDAKLFNESTYRDPRVLQRKRLEEIKETARLAEKSKSSSTTTSSTTKRTTHAAIGPGSSTNSIDKEFFVSGPVVRAGAVGKNRAEDVTRTKVYPHQGGEGAGVLDKGSKKHRKGKKGKVRTRWTVDE